MGKANILIVEDEERLAEILKKQLIDSGFNSDIANDGYVGKRLAAANNYDLIILDINLPLVNGYDLCKEIRITNKNIPIIMLTAFGTYENKLTGFDVGADDYIVKPFDFRELLARINVFLKRTDKDQTSVKLTVADLEIDLINKTVIRGDRKIDLTAREFDLLATFMKNKDKLVTREFIIEQVWGIDFDPSTNIIDVYLNYLRNKIDRDFKTKLLHTKFGFGFYISEKEI